MGRGSQHVFKDNIQPANKYVKGYSTSIVPLEMQIKNHKKSPHTYENHSIQRESPWKLQEKNIRSLPRKAVRVGADSQRTNEGQKGARQHTQSAARKHWETRVLSPTKPSLGKVKWSLPQISKSERICCYQICLIGTLNNGLDWSK